MCVRITPPEVGFAVQVSVNPARHCVAGRARGIARYLFGHARGLSWTSAGLRVWASRCATSAASFGPVTCEIRRVVDQTKLGLATLSQCPARSRPPAGMSRRTME